MCAFKPKQVFNNSAKWKIVGADKNVSVLVGLVCQVASQVHASFSAWVTEMCLKQNHIVPILPPSLPIFFSHFEFLLWFCIMSNQTASFAFSSEYSRPPSMMFQVLHCRGIGQPKWPGHTSPHQNTFFSFAQRHPKGLAEAQLLIEFRLHPLSFGFWKIFNWSPMSSALTFWFILHICSEINFLRAYAGFMLI